MGYQEELEYCEVYKLNADYIETDFIGTTCDFGDAVLLAGSVELASVHVVPTNGFDHVVLYSDDPDLYSSRWWVEEIAKVRSRLLERKMLKQLHRVTA